MRTKLGITTGLSGFFRRSGLRTATGCAALLAAVTASLLVGAPAANAGTLHLFRDDATDMCLDSNSAGNVYTLPCQPGNNYQTWDVTIQYDYSYSPPREFRMMRDVATNRCLDSNGSGNVYTTNPCQIGNHYQYWVRGTAPNGDATYMDWATFRYLDSNMLTGGLCGCVIQYKGDVYTLGYNGGANQSWYVLG